MRLQERVTLFQERLQRVILHSGLNRSSFATSIRVDRSTLSQLLSTENVRLPRADTVLSIAEVYQVSIDWLLGITQEGDMGANIVHEAFEVDDSGTSIFEKNLEWHREARGYKIRYVPTTLPDLLKTEAVAEYEFNRYGSGKIDQSVRDNQLLLLQQRHPGSELETCMPLHHLESFALGEGIWRDLPLAGRRQQLQRMIELNEELYPGFRWFLYDGKQTYSISMTIFGPMRVSLFLGKLYIIVNNIDHIRKITDRFDDLIRMAVVHPHEIGDFLQRLLQRCK
ncbi:MAG TPA: helix-turn-helix transcriptional regulator [Gammaproteobacteria bacterium]|nr:helix-turn-helix transcriptional regulator [Gammaproteobacteria bacterium]